jgi:hypothetical protein
MLIRSTHPELFVVNLRATKAFGFGGGEKKSSSQGQGGGGGGGQRGGINSPFGGGGGGGQRGSGDDESKYKLTFTAQIRNLSTIPIAGCLLEIFARH